MNGGPEFRRDAISGRWVAVAPQRSLRPADGFGKPGTEVCPFCEGSESQTPPESSAIRLSGAADEPGWLVRTFPNKYPIVSLDATSPIEAHRLAGTGVHEVVVESPRHNWSLTDCDDEHWSLVFRMYRDRMRWMSERKDLASAMVFHNGGRAAGASQEHVHSQIIATPHVPPLVDEELRRSAEASAEGRDLFQDLIERELAAEHRLVATTERFVVLCPFASRFADEAWVLPMQPLSNFEDASDDLIAELAAVMRRLLTAVEATGGDMAYNYWLHSAPFGDASGGGFRWHWEVAPRTTGIAGWELGGGTFVNPSTPEASAAKLRRLWFDAASGGNR